MPKWFVLIDISLQKNEALFCLLEQEWLLVRRRCQNTVCWLFKLTPAGDTCPLLTEQPLGVVARRCPPGPLTPQIQANTRFKLEAQTVTTQSEQLVNMHGSQLSFHLWNKYYRDLLHFHFQYCPFQKPYYPHLFFSNESKSSRVLIGDKGLSKCCLLELYKPGSVSCGFEPHK